MSLLGVVEETAKRVSDVDLNAVGKDIKQKLDMTYQDVVRGVRKIKTSAEDAVEETRLKIKANPLAVVAGVTVGAFAAGVLAGYIIRSRRQ